MKIKAFLQMKDDFERLDFTLFNFVKHNPEIPILVVNDGGQNPSVVTDKYSQVTLVNFSESSWVKNGGNGTFGPEWFKRLYEYAESDSGYTHLLFLETDVLTRRTITINPAYDMSGFMNCSGPAVNKVCHSYFNLQKYGYEFNKMGGVASFLHTGCGGTIYSKDFFDKTRNNLDFILDAYRTIPEYCFQDVLITILGIISGCSVGKWKEVTQMATPHFEIDGFNPESAMIHGYKVDIVREQNNKRKH